jgi:hypothetical protein
MRSVERLLVVLTLAILTSWAWGQSPVILEIPDVQGMPGTDVWVGVNITIPEEVEILSGQFTLKYDPEILTCREIKPGSLLADYLNPPMGGGYRGSIGAAGDNVTPYFTSNVDKDDSGNETGNANIAFAGIEPLPVGSGELVKVRFGVKSGFQEGDESDLDIDQPLFNEDIIPEVNPGKIIYGGAVGEFISVRVIDKDTTEVIAGATVELRNTEGEVVASAVTGDDGICQLGGASAGVSYLVRAYKRPASPGYFPNIIEDVTIDTGQVDVPLKRIPDVTATDKWVDFYGSATFDGKPVLPGDVILAKDPDGVICGYFSVENEGQYGFLHVYGDDTTTADVDEGAGPGDTIGFFFNEEQYPAAETGTWTTDGDRNRVDLSFARSREVTLHLIEGWNLISFNVEPENTDIQDVLSPIEGKYVVVRGFKQSAKTYDPQLPEFSDLREMTPPYGYWIKATEDVDLIISGIPVPPDTPISLDQGWNLIGYLPEQDKPIEEALETIMDQLIVARGFEETAKTYDPELPDFSDLRIMKPGLGYWLKVTSAVTLNYMGGGSQAPAAPVLANRDFTPTYINVDLYGEVYLNGEPAPEGTKIEAYAGNVKCGEIIISRPGVYGFLHVYGDDPFSPVQEGALPGDKISLRVNGIPVNANVIWTKDGDRVKIDLFAEERVIPEKTVLLQNFPNPFNPETWMPFQLAKDADVTIEIYNSTGGIVRRLMLGHKRAGLYTSKETAAYWDGRNEIGEKVSSGVYFYKIKAGDYTAVKRMILMK